MPHLRSPYRTRTRGSKGNGLSQLQIPEAVAVDTQQLALPVHAGKVGGEVSKYRIVETKPGLYQIERRWWLGWWRCEQVFVYAYDAEQAALQWQAEDKHVTRVVKEIEA